MEMTLSRLMAQRGSIPGWHAGAPFAGVTLLAPLSGVVTITGPGGSWSVDGTHPTGFVAAPHALLAWGGPLSYSFSNAADIGRASAAFSYFKGLG